MFHVRNDRDFREGYEMLNLFGRLDGHFDNPEKARENVLNLKRELRKWAHRDTTTVDVGYREPVERRIVRDYGMDGYMELVKLPVTVESVEDGEEFFKAFLEITYRPTYYDCTGQAFTSWYKIFQRGGQFCVYHSVGFDV